MNTLCEMFQQTAQRFPDGIAVHHRSRDWKYSEMWARAASLSSWLSERGLEKGERVGLLVANSAEYVASYFGVLLAGGVVVSLNPDTTSRDLANTLGHCEASAVVVAGECETYLRNASSDLQSLRMVIRVDPGEDDLLDGRPHGVFSEIWNEASASWQPTEVTLDDFAQIIYTSGTTGRPKGVTLSHRNLSANCHSIVQYLGLTSDNSIFVTLPFYYSYGNSLLLTHVAVGGRLIIASDFVFLNRALDLMEAQRATGFSGVPSSYAMLLHKSNFMQRKLPDLRYLTCAGGGLAPAVIRRLKESLPHIRIFPMYGQTEAAARLSTLMPEEVDVKLGSIGKGIPGVKLAVLDEHGQPVAPGKVGEIVAQGDNVMVGYWNDPQGTESVLRPEGLRTRDLATVDEDGYLYIVGRTSDIIKYGAYRINPQEIEEVILELDGVAEVAVAGIADEVFSEIPVAFIVPSSNGLSLSEDDVQQHCLANLPRHKLVRSVRFVESLPKTSSGKIRRQELRNLSVD